MPWLWVAAALAHVPELYVVGADDDWCGTIDDAQTGDIIMLEPGEYVGPCSIEGNIPDYPGEILTVQAYDLYDQPRLVYGGGDFVVELVGQDVMLSSLVFEGVPAGASAVSVEAEDATVRFTTFTAVDGTAVLAGKGATRLIVNDSTFFTGGGTAIEVGCDDGGCAVEGFEVVDNLVVGLDRGVVAHVGSSGELRDNVLDAVGTAFTLAGGEVRTEVDGNLVRADVGLAITGGPALVTNNLLLTHDVAVRGALTGGHGVRVLGNTLTGAWAFQGSGWTGDDEVVSNAMQGAFDLTGAAEVASNVACDANPADCWLDPAGHDYFPAPESPLREAGQAAADGVLLGDWCGRARSDPPSAGAIEGVGDLGFGPLAFDFKKRFDCTLDVSDTGSPDTGAATGSGTGAPTGSGTATGAGTATGTGTATGATGSGGDSGAPTGGTTSPPTTDDDTGNARRAPRERAAGCGCAAGRVVPWPALLLLGLGLRTRGRRSAPRTGRPARRFR